MTVKEEVETVEMQEEVIVCDVCSSEADNPITYYAVDEEKGMQVVGHTCDDCDGREILKGATWSALLERPLLDVTFTKKTWTLLTTIMVGSAALSLYQIESVQIVTNIDNIFTFLLIMTFNIVIYTFLGLGFFLAIQLIR